MSPPSSDLIGLSESVNILGVRGVICMWRLVFDSRHHFIFNNNKNNKMLNQCLLFIADPSDLGSGKICVNLVIISIFF